MNKQSVVYPHNGILLGDKKEQTVDNQKTWMNLIGIMLSGGRQSQKATYWLIHCPKENTTEMDNRSMVARVEGGGEYQCKGITGKSLEWRTCSVSWRGGGNMNLYRYWYKELYTCQNINFAVHYFKNKTGTPLAVHWLGLQASTEGGTDLIPGRGTRILHTTRHGQNISF